MSFSRYSLWPALLLAALCLTPLASASTVVADAAGECVRCGVDGAGDKADKVSELTLVYSGDAGRVQVYNDGDAKADELLFDGFLNTGDQFTIQAMTLGEDEFNNEISFFVDGQKVAELHASCSSPLGPGANEQNQDKGEDPNGSVDVTVLSGKDSQGRKLCGVNMPPMPPGGADCVRCGVDGSEDKADKVSQLTLMYSGAAGRVQVYNDGDAEADELLFDGMLSPGDEFTIMASDVGEDEFNNEISFFVDGQKVAELHASCSSPLGPGANEQNQDKGEDPNGAVDVTVVSGLDGRGRELCPIQPPPPPPPGGADCVRCGVDGAGDKADDIVQLTFRYEGAAGRVVVYNDGDAKSDEVLFDGFLNPGDTFSIDAATLGEDKLSKEIGVFVDGRKVAELHTSCSSPLGPGTTEQNQEKGKDPNGMLDITVLGGRDSSGRALCDIPPPPPPGADCVRCGVDGAGDKADDIVQLTFRYEGAAGRVVVYNDGDAKSDEVLFDGFLNPGDTFSIDAATLGEDKLSKEIGVFVDGRKVAELHTSCSSPLGPGTTEQNQEKGKDPNGMLDITVLGGRDSSGRALCDIPPPPPPGANCVECGTGEDDAEKLASLTLEYLGAPGFVRVYDNDDTDAENLLFAGDLDTGDTFTIMASAIDEDAFSSRVGFYLDGTDDSDKIAELHTSCSAEVIPDETTEANQSKGEDPNGMADFLVRAGVDRDGNPLCDDDPCPDAGPPVITYSAVDMGDPHSGGMSFIEMRVTDDTGIQTVTFEEEGTDNLTLVESDFTPGATTAFFRFKIEDITEISRLRASATDVCGTTLCPAGEPNATPSLTSNLVVVDDETGDFQDAAIPRPQPNRWDRFARLIEATDDTGITKYETFARFNAFVFAQPDETCDADGGCALAPPQSDITVIIAADVVPGPTAEFGLFVADECNVFVFDPPIAGTNARTSGAHGSLTSCPGVAPDMALLSAGESFEFGLDQNRPNPFSDRSVISFTMPESGAVHLAVYDMLGRTVQVVAEGTFEAGQHSVALDAAQIPSGTYVYRLTSDHGTASRQMVITR